MCIICYKPKNIAFPEEAILQNCFSNNDDGAGYMYAYNNNVYISKGFTTFDNLKKSLEKTRKLTGDNVPYVLHFRIATQGYKKQFTHPFPLSGAMSKLKLTRASCNIGVAHNGIIDLTSDGSLNYSDTMKFITDYLSLIIRSYSWYKDDRTKLLIERLIGNSRLAVLDKKGHCELLGKGWLEDGGLYFSNSTYSYSKPKIAYPIFDDGYYFAPVNYSKVGKNYDMNYSKKTGRYYFNEFSCPVALEDDYTYCDLCNKKHNCRLTSPTLDDYDS